ncbi:MAG: Protein oar [Thermoanaerobaculia bacterium]|nr:Protein oar [Thermoanaerobaculia bacterium]
MEIRSGGYEAEYGKALGGNINVLTKSGGPGFRGGVFGYYASDSLGAADEHEADRKVINSPTLEVPVQSDAGFNLGGPLLRDRIWFFGAYDRLSKVQDYRAIDHVTFSETGARQNFYEDRTDRTLANLFALNFSWMPASSQSVSLSIFGDPSSGTTRSDANPGPAYATTTEKITGGTDVSARWTGFFGAFIAEVQYGYHEEDGREVSEFQNRPVFFDIRNGVFQLIEGSGAWTTNEHWRLVDATYRRNSIQLSGSVNLGAHELKAGALHELQNPNRTARISGGEVVFNYYLRDGSYDGSVHEYFASAPLNCTKLTTGQTGNFGYVNPVECLAWQKTDAVRSDARSRNLSVFVQDSWRPFSNLTLKAGLRYDQQEIYASGGAQGLTLKDQWSPRLSIAWDPAGNGRVKAFGSYGRYYQAFPIYVQGRFYSGESVAYVVNDSRGVDPVGTWEAGLESPVYVPGDLKGMFQDEITLGVEVEAMKSLAVGLRGVYRSLGRALEDRCDRDDPIVGSAFPPDGYGKCAFVNPGYGALGQYRDPANPDCFEDFPVNTIPAPCESVRASRIYRGLELTVQYRPAKDLYAMASYVYSKLEGNYDGLIFHGGAGGQQVEPGLGGAFDYTAGLPNNFGRLPGDRTHQVKLSGSYTLPFGLTAGVMGQFWTGEPLSIYGWSSVFYSGQVKADRFLEPRGSSGEMPSTYSIDLHLHYDWRIGSVTVTPAVDIFNLTNVQPALSRWTMYNTPATISNDKPPYTNPTNPRFGRDVTWQRPRLIQLGLKAAF